MHPNLISWLAAKPNTEKVPGERGVREGRVKEGGKGVRSEKGYIDSKSTLFLA